jgi:hypothetical protein
MVASRQPAPVTRPTRPQVSEPERIRNFKAEVQHNQRARVAALRAQRQEVKAKVEAVRQSRRERCEHRPGLEESTWTLKSF